LIDSRDFQNAEKLVENQVLSPRGRGLTSPAEPSATIRSGFGKFSTSALSIPIWSFSMAAT
jgi:hypothetical protein